MFREKKTETPASYTNHSTPPSWLWEPVPIWRLRMGNTEYTMSCSSASFRNVPTTIHVAVAAASAIVSFYNVDINIAA